MASQMTNYQCPRCMGPMHFDSATGNVQCEYCDSTYTVEEVEALFREKNEQAEQAKPVDWDIAQAGSAWGEEGTQLRTYQCPSCGALLDCDETTAATECPYCGNPTIIPSQLSGSLKPDFVIPFQVSREDALAALRKHYGGKKLLPRLFSQESRLEKVQGVYVPFWLYDGTADCTANFTGEQHIVTRTKNTEITQINTFRLFREGSISFRNLPVDASVKMDDDLMDSLEPYDMADLKPFSMSYLPGYLADHFDVDSENCAQRANDRATNTTRRFFARSTGDYVNVTTLSENIHLTPKGVHCALLPVWMLTTQWAGKTYTFAMNGQTGKLVGDLPIDKKRYWQLRLTYGAVIAAVLYALQWLAVLL